MSEWHPDRDQLERFLEDEMRGEESRELQRHLFSCAACEERMIALLPGWTAVTSATPSPETGEEEYRGLLKRVLADNRAEMEKRGSRLTRERAEAGPLLGELIALPPGRRVARVREGVRFRNWGLFELLVERARKDIFEDPRGAEASLEAAVEIADHLDPRRYGPGSVEAAQARAWAWLGNARRVLFDFRSAEEAFVLAESYLERSWLDPLDQALVLELTALLRRAQRRFDEALALLDQAIDLYREVNEPHFEGRARIAKGLALQYAGEIDPAAACLREGLSLIDPAEEPRLLFAAHCNLLLCLVDGGRYAEARDLIEHVRPLCEEAGTRPDLLRLRWIEGRVASGLDRLAEAEAAFGEVRAAFLAGDAAYDAALVSLDLATVYAREKRPAEVKRLAAELLPIFRSREIHREAIAALLCFQRAAEMERVTLSLIETVSSYLERSRSNPGLRFRARGPKEGQGEEARGVPGDRRDRQAPTALAS
jgi:tetratricopeptide (TPR) repeat protein